MVALAGCLVLLVVPALIVWTIGSSTRSVDSATVWAGYLAPVAIGLPLLVSLTGWWWKGHPAAPVAPAPEQIAAAADRVAEVVLDTWRREAKDRQISTPAPARVRWHWADVTTPPAELSTPPEAGAGPQPLAENNPDRSRVLLDDGIVTRLHDEVYARLPHGRLVLIGRSGAGKTGAMILLLLAALAHRHRVPKARRDEVPVPVWLTMGSWNPTNQTLREWAIATMYRDHPYLRATDYGSDAAAELLRTGRVALFLDGLDEMAANARATAFRRLEEETAGLRIVVTSRPDEYRYIITTEPLHNTAVLELAPMRPAEAHAYLLIDQTGPQRDRWNQVGDYLEHHPDSVAAHALNNPLTLSLARATYRHQDPAVLTDTATFPTVADLREHLIDRTLSTAYPDEHERDHATRWLTWIAHHMQSNQDLAWWHIPTWIPPRRLRRVAGLTVGLTGVLVLGIMVGVQLGTVGGVLVGLGVGITPGMVAGLAVTLTVALRSHVGREPNAVRPHWPRPREIPRLLDFGLASALILGLAFALMVGLTGGGLMWGGLVGGFVVAVGLVIGLTNLWRVPLPRSAAATPATTYHIARRTSILIGLMSGFVVALTFGLPVAFSGASRISASRTRSRWGSWADSWVGSRAVQCPWSFLPNLSSR